jgi:hypothetical protein
MQINDNQVKASLELLRYTARTGSAVLNKSNAWRNYPKSARPYWARFGSSRRENAVRQRARCRGQQVKNNVSSRRPNADFAFGRQCEKTVAILS